MNMIQTIRICGIILIGCAISLFGVSKGESARKKVKYEKEYMRLLKHIESSVKYTSKPISQIISDFNSSFIDCDELQILPKTKDGHIQNEHQKQLKNLFENLGKAYTRTRAESLCKIAVEAAENKVEKITKDELTKSVLYKKLGIIFGILTAIILF